MTEQLFDDLKYVHGFCNVNGETYRDHICIIFNRKLTDDQKKIIMSKNNSTEALAYLENIINFTHKY
jgi:hypothetical protein